MKDKGKISKKKAEAGKAAPVSTAPKKASSQTGNRSADQILHLQGTIGNREVQRLIKSGTLQAKLTIGKPNDKYEQEADRVADQVMSMLDPGVQRQPEEEKEEIQTKPLADQITPLVQRQADEEEEPFQTKLLQRQEAEEEEEPVQTKLQRQEKDEEEEPIQAKPASNQKSAVSSNIESSVNSLKGGGQPLSESTRSYFEPRFGADFSGVRIHHDTQAAETAKSINAKAFTTGKDVVFGSGQYSPETSLGKKLLAHELSHVVQQSSTSNSMTNSPEIVQRDDITQMSITPEYARGLSDEALREQIRTLREQVQSLEPFMVSTPEEVGEFQPEAEGDYEVAQSNLSILQTEQRRRNTERQRRNWDVTQMSITPAYARRLSDEALREQIRTLREQVQSLEPFMGATPEEVGEFQPEAEGDYEVAQSNLSILQAERLRRNRAVTRTSITPGYARGLPDEDLREQIQILTEQIQSLEPSRTSTPEGEGEFQPEAEGDYEVAQSNLSILQAEQRRRRVEQRRSRIRGADWGSFRTHRDIDAAVSLEDRVVYVMESLVQQYNYPVDGAAGLVGNLMVESGGTMAPNILEGGRLARRGESAPQRGGVGLVQWTGERREAVLETEQGVDILFDMDAQIAYMVRELRGRYAVVNNVLNNPADLNQATRRVFRDYETPQVVVDWRRAVRGGDPAEIQGTEQIMNRAEGRRRQEARRSRDLYLREHSEQ